MKKFSILWCLILIFTLAGCGMTAPEATTDPIQTVSASDESDISEKEVSESVAVTADASAVSASSQAALQTTAVYTSEAQKSTETTGITQKQTAPLTEPTKTVTTTEKVTASETKKNIVTAAQKPSVSASEETNTGEYCYVTISCETINDNKNKIKKEKLPFVPDDGIILHKTKVSFTKGESAFDVLRRACQENVCSDRCQYCLKNGIQLEYTYTPAFETYYVEGIHQIYEMDCGSSSGWMYSVNGSFPSVGSSDYRVAPGDNIVFSYTCDNGMDIEGSY
ncbi:MAG: DUF4430 domain-containing protein [Acutalibacteraceae bacterium]